MLSWLPLLTGLALLAPPGERYLTREQAIKIALPGADRVVERDISLNAEDVAKVRKRYGSAFGAAQKILIGFRGDEVVGYAQINREITRTLYVTFIVAVDPRGRISDVAVMSHDEHIGTDCRKSRFLGQFRGKHNGNALRVGSGGGITKYKGATMSCAGVARGVRKTVAVVQHHFLDRPANVRALSREEPVRRQKYVMGTLCTITAFGEADVVERAFSEIRRLDRVLSNYDPESELSRLNREGELRVSDDLLTFVRESRKFWERSGGAFDVTAAPLVALWGFKDGKHRVPAEDEIRQCLSRVGSDRIAVEGRKIRLAKGMSLDPGAIGKGIAVDAAVSVLRKAGIERALVDFGSTVYALGSWDLPVRDPFRADRGLATVALRNQALSTSGNYEKFFEVEGVRYAHILDPRTGKPVRGVASASVIALTATESDAGSTIAFVRNELPPDRPALLVSTEGAMKKNDAWSRLVTEETE